MRQERTCGRTVIRLRNQNSIADVADHLYGLIYTKKMRNFSTSVNKLWRWHKCSHGAHTSSSDDVLVQDLLDRVEVIIEKLSLSGKESSRAGDGIAYGTMMDGREIIS